MLSIIIPIYNGANCIARCLDSIWSQGLLENEYEVICVNDCSTDDTAAVIRNIQQSHTNLRLFNNAENLRAGGGRNRGVREAAGEYILFIDADDYFHPGALKTVVTYLRKNPLDILMGDFARETISNPNNTLIHNFPNREVLSGEDFFLKNSCPFGPCKYIFRRNLMINNTVFFEERVCCEDVDWTHRLALKAKKMQYQPILLSHVVINEFSQTANEHLYLRPVVEKIFAGNRLYQLSKEYSGIISDRLNDVAAVYYKQGIRYMTAVAAPIKLKHEAICKYIPTDIALPRTVEIVRRMPYTFSLVTNFTASIVSLLIKIKRKYAGR